VDRGVIDTAADARRPLPAFRRAAREWTTSCDGFRGSARACCPRGIS